MLQMSGEKMAKSVGNIATLADVIDAHGRDALVMFFAGAHYRQPMQFSDERMAEAAARVARVRDAARRLAPRPVAGGPRAVEGALLRRAGRRLQHADGAGGGLRLGPRGQPPRPGTGSDDLREMLEVLGLENLLEADAGPDAEAQALLEAREAARAARDWAEADRLRDELAARGWQVRDGAAGPELVRAS